MKIFLVFVVALLPALYSAVSSSDSIITSWTKNSNKAKSTFTTGSFLNDVTAIYYDTSYVYVKAEGIPSYGVGPWTANPNTPKGQSYVFKFPVSTTANSGVKRDISSELGPTGVWGNGVPIYNAYDGVSVGSVWHRNAYMYEGISFDSCNGHPDGSGAYHNHINPACLYATNRTTSHSPIIGWSFDGYPVYGPYAYTNKSDATSAIKRMVSSYRTRSISQRRTLANGTTLAAANYGPDVNTTYPIGSYLEDYEYSAGLGDLDECNGRFGVTPEFPSGVYAYFVTVDASYTPVYPLAIGPYYYGSAYQRSLRDQYYASVPTGATKVFDNASNNLESQKLMFVFSIMITMLISKIF